MNPKYKELEEKLLTEALEATRFQDRDKALAQLESLYRSATACRGIGAKEFKELAEEIHELVSQILPEQAATGLHEKIKGVLGKV